MKKTGNPRKKPKKNRHSKNNKFACQQKHAIKRAEQRYGLVLNNHDLNQLKNEIQAGNASVMERRSNRVSIYALNTMAGEVPVVYDHMRQTVVSFLPEQYFLDNDKKSA